MENFKSMLIQEAINTKRLQKMLDEIDKLVNLTRPEAVMPRTISKEFGDGYKKDFQEINDHLTKAGGMIEDIIYEISQG